MRIGAIYSAIPILFALGVTIYAATSREEEIGSSLSLFSYGVFFYGAPYFVLALIHLSLKPSPKIMHAGYLGTTVALAAISSLWLLPQDPSGLPIQWMAYWPLSAILSLIFMGCYSAYRKYGNS